MTVPGRALEGGLCVSPPARRCHALRSVPGTPHGRRVLVAPRCSVSGRAGPGVGYRRSSALPRLRHPEPLNRGLWRWGHAPSHSGGWRMATMEGFLGKGFDKTVLCVELKKALFELLGEGDSGRPGWL